MIYSRKLFLVKVVLFGYLNDLKKCLVKVFVVIC